MRFPPISKPAIVAALCAVAALFSFGPNAYGQSAIPARTADPAVLRMQERIDQLEIQVRALTGDNERLRFELSQSRERLDRLERRVGDLLAARDAAGTTPGAAPGAAAAPSAARPAPAAGDAGAAFDSAKRLLDAGDFGGAEIAFAGFLTAFPQDARKPEALYWHGRTLMSRSANREAGAAFLEVVRDHARAPIAPEAMVQLGVALNRMGETAGACQTFGDLERRFPRASAATKAAAAREARAARCAA